MPRQYIPEIQPAQQAELPNDVANQANYFHNQALADAPGHMHPVDYPGQPEAQQHMGQELNPDWLVGGIDTLPTTTAKYWKGEPEKPYRPKLQYVTDEKLADIRQQALKTALEIYEGSDKTKSICQLATEYEQWLLGNG